MDGFQNRKSPKDGKEDFPTPKWATRIFMDHCLPDDLSESIAWEPCANRGYMVDVMREKFANVIGSDLYDYGAGFPVIDFLEGQTPMDHGMEVDFILTNPPFNLAEAFFHRWWKDMPTVEHFGMLLRASWLEGIGRYENVFSKHNPAYVCPYVQRVAIVQGRLDKKAVSQMPYAWFQWERSRSKHSPTRVKWIPPGRKDYERDGDWPGDETQELVESIREVIQDDNDSGS